MEELIIIPDDRDLEADSEEWEKFLHHVSVLNNALGDKLEVILELQRELDEYVDKLRGIQRTDTRLWVRRNALAGLMEATEFIDGLNWKWWTNPKDLDKKSLLEALAALLHFVVSAMNIAGMKADNVHAISTEKFDRLDWVFARARADLKEELKHEEKDELLLSKAVKLARVMSELYDTPDTYKYDLKEALRTIAELTILIGADENDLFKAYVIKNFKNRARQKSKKFRGGQYFAGNSHEDTPPRYSGE